MAQSTEIKIKNRVQGKGRGWCFTPVNFSDLGSTEAVNTALHRLENKGLIVRLSHGIYEFPVVHKEFGVIPPDPVRIANALAEKFEIRIQPSGAYAANLLGITEQVPARIVFLTDGANKKLKIGNIEIEFKKTTPKVMKMAGRVSGVVVQALKYIGKDSVDDSMISQIKSQLDNKSKERLRLDVDLAPAWISKIILKQILSEE